MASQAKTILYLLKEKEAKLKKEVKNHRNGAAKKQIMEKLKEIADARKRLSESTYGFCTHCFKSIPWRELCNQPERTACESCQSSTAARAG